MRFPRLQRIFKAGGRARIPFSLVLPPEWLEFRERCRNMSQSPTTENFDATILVVEDDELLREMLEVFLERRRYRVLTAMDADQALGIARDSGAGKIDLLLTDVDIPGMNGFELAQEVRQVVPEVRLLILSGSPEKELEAMPKPVGGWEFLRKPCPPDTVAERVQAMLAQRGASGS
jgi:two-component system, OmpR family, phosphate regulon response regulator OmpR